MSTIFVGGAPRTGTTLMHLLLCQAAGANPFVREAGYLRQLVALYPEAQNLAYSTDDYFDSPDDLRTFHASLVRHFLDHARRHFGGHAHLVLKEPTLTRYFPVLDELLGREAQFVCMIRDPRDTVASLVKVADRQTAMGGEPIPGDRIRNACAHYRSFYAPLFQSNDRGLLQRILFVRYCDLVLTPDPVIDALEQRLGLDLSRARRGGAPDCGRVDFSDPATQASPWHSDLWGKAISAERLGTYRSVLSSGEVRTVEDDLKDVFETFNFPLEQDAA